MIKLVLLGPPGAGKGTQAARISLLYNIPHISTGEILRNNIKDKTSLGLEADNYIKVGALVPDGLINELIKQRLENKDCANGYLLDGYPRTIVQAELLTKITALSKVINLVIKEEALILRLTGRRVCSECGENYNVSNNTKDFCTNCGGALIQREDDKLETILKRIEVYKNSTKPLIDYYKKMNILVDIDADNLIDKVFFEIRRAIEK